MYCDALGGQAADEFRIRIAGQDQGRQRHAKPRTRGRNDSMTGCPLGQAEVGNDDIGRLFTEWPACSNAIASAARTCGLS